MNNMRMLYCLVQMILLGIVSVDLVASQEELAQKAFVVVIPSYNNKDWYRDNLDSIFQQNYENYRVIYIDDASPDDTGNLVEHYIKQKNMAHKVTLIKNKTNQGALANTYRAVHMCKPHEIVVIVDGDDWLSDPHALEYLNNVYQDPDVWMTYGQFVEFPSGEKAQWVHKIPDDIILSNAFRQYEWVTSHARTFYAALFQRIDAKDLQENDLFLPTAGDLAAMFPMLEMAGERNRYISRVMYIYNLANQINDHKVRRPLQIRMDQLIRSRKKYEPLASLDEIWDSFFSLSELGFNERVSYPKDFFETVRINNKLFDLNFAAKQPAWLLAKELYENNIARLDTHSEIMRIPMVFHLIWLGSPVPQSYKRLAEQLKKLNPHCSVRIWTDVDVLTYPMSDKNRMAFNKAVNYGEKADIFRYEILYREGGVYLDGDFRAIRSMEDLFYAYDFFVGMSQNRDFEVLNGLIGSVPGHPILKYCVENIVAYKGDSNQAPLKQSIMERTGPYYLTRAFVKCAQENNMRNIALPPSYLYPWPHYLRHETSAEKIRRMIQPFSFVFHEWACSWQTAKKNSV